MGETVEEAAASKMAVGRRHFRCDEFAAAVDCFQEALEVLVAAHGELDARCAEAYYYYGAAILASSRNEGIFGGAAADAAAAADAEDEDSEEEGDGDAPAENASGEKEAAANEGATDGAQQGEAETTEGASSADKTAPAPAKDDETVENLQLAWENLECARIIYTREAEAAVAEGRADARDLRLMLAKVHLQLGEVCLETESFDNADEDFAKCVAIRSEILPADDRGLAEALYQRSLAQQFAGRHADAVKSLEDASHALSLRRDRLLSALGGKGKGVDTDQSASGAATGGDDAVSEINELKELLADLAAKIEELKEDQRNTASILNSIRSAASAFGASSESNPFSAAASSAGAAPAFGSSVSGSSSSAEPAPIPFSFASCNSDASSAAPFPFSFAPTAGGLTGASVPAAAAPVVNDIGSLVKRKAVPKPDVNEAKRKAEEPPADDPAAKRAKEEVSA